MFDVRWFHRLMLREHRSNAGHVDGHEGTRRVRERGDDVAHDASV